MAAMQIQMNEAEVLPELVGAASPMPEIPDKLYFRIGDVAKLAGIKPYVLRYWETEFPGLGPKKSGTGHRLYRRKDVEMVLEIKRLLYDQRFTIEGARKTLESKLKSEPASKPVSKKKSTERLTLVPPRAQAGLFDTSSPMLAVVREELLEIVELLK